jgi:RNA polymerase sigma-70 factor, ECF subfamily
MELSNEAILGLLKKIGDGNERAMHELYEAFSRGESKFSTWLIGIARHKMIDAFRAKQPDHDDLDDQMPSDSAGVFEELANKQRREGVQECMGKLTDEHRECLHLVFYEGMAIHEVADIQKCPQNTVKTRLFHARQKIKNCLRLLLERE